MDLKKNTPPRLSERGAVEHGHSTSRLLSVPEAATYLGIGVRQVHRLRSDGVLPFVKIGRRTLFDRLDINLLIEANRQREGGAR